MPIESSVYVCGYCDSRYSKEEDAIACESCAKQLEEYKTSLLPWKWYRLTAVPYNNGTRDVFVSKIHYNYSCSSMDCCSRQCVSLFSYNWNSYYNVPTSWTIDEILSPMEMYKKYGIFLDNGIYVGEDGYPPQCNPAVERIPRSVAEELDAVNRLALEDLTQQVSQASSKEELARKLVLCRHPMLQCTNYFERVVEYQEKHLDGKDRKVTDSIKGLNYGKDTDVLTKIMDTYD